MKQIILDLITTNPKHFSKIIKNKPELYKWVLENTKVQSNIFAEMVYSAVYEVSNICLHGNIKKFYSINTGFIGCGPASKCECTRNVVSSKVKESKSKTTVEQQEEINNKRKNTNLKKYGVTCVYQTPKNRQKFQDWYADPKNVKQNLERIRATNLQRYGVENCKSLPEVEEKIIATCLARYGVKNVSQIPSTKAKLRARTAEYKLTGHFIRKGYQRFKQYIEQSSNLELLTSIDEYQGVQQTQYIKIRCKVCNNEETIKFYYSKDLSCFKCNPKTPAFVSGEEQEIYNYITNELGVLNGVQGDKRLINPYEIDMVFSNEKIAIEYCGLYWHSEASTGKGKNYHRNKLQLVSEKGYRLITIFSDEWNHRRDIVKSKLANIFGKTTTRYYARNLILDSVSDKESKLFQEKHHLQGFSSAKINLGLYSGDKLVALMTFSKGRAALNSKSIDDEYELVRFVTDGSSVVGGASKLLKHFIKLYSPKLIISYSDERWSQGKLYETLGFKKITAPTVGYWYVDNYSTRLHRFNFTKQSLVRAGNDPKMTEWEIMQSLGYDRIWDCGHQKFIYKVE